MLVFKVLSHGWKQSLRSASRGQNTTGNIIMLVFFVLLGVNLLGLGLFLHTLLQNLEPGVDPVQVFNASVVYYLGIDLLLRQALQRIPGQAIVPYLTLRLNRSILIHLLLWRSFFSLFNLLPWMIAIPFAASAVLPAVGLGATSGWLVTLAFLIAANSLLNLFLKKLSVTRSALAFAIGSALAVLYALDLLEVISLSAITQALLGAVLERPVIGIVVLVLPALLYGLSYWLLQSLMYLEDLSPAGVVRADAASRYRFLESAGDRGRFVALELKLFFRNRRARASLITGLTVIPLGVLFYGMIFQAERDPYPIPAIPALEAGRSLESGSVPPGYVRVTFAIDTGVVPPIAHPYVTGNHPTLSDWKPAALPLLRNPDSTWSRSFLFEKGTELRYCFTLGAWQTQEKIGDGSEPPIYSMKVQADTTVLRSVIVWETPELPLIIIVNILYWGLLITGILMFVYGQFFLSWDSTFFDALLVWRIPFRWMLRTKVLVLYAAAVLSFVLTIPYALIDARLLLFNGLAFLYNIGVNSYVLLILAARSKKRFELNESIFSQQGKGAAQFVAVLPMWILPVIIYAVLDALGVPYAEYVFFGGLGILGLLLHRPLLKGAVSLLENNRYEIASGFRQGGTI